MWAFQQPELILNSIGRVDCVIKTFKQLMWLKMNRNNVFSCVFVKCTLCSLFKIWQSYREFKSRNFFETQCMNDWRHAINVDFLIVRPGYRWYWNIDWLVSTKYCPLYVVLLGQWFSNFFDHGPLFLRYSWRTSALVTVKYTTSTKYPNFCAHRFLQTYHHQLHTNYIGWQAMLVWWMHWLSDWLMCANLKTRVVNC